MMDSYGRTELLDTVSNRDRFDAAYHSKFSSQGETMTVDNALQEKTHQEVGEYLSELFEAPFEDSSEGHYFVRYGTTVLEISVEPYGEDETAVRIVAYCAQGVRLELDLALGLLELNHTLPFGAFTVVGSDVFFCYSVLGRTLEPRILLRAIDAVANVADEYDERIVAKFGGQTALAALQQEAAGGEPSEQLD